jgi:hypothetical protein
MSDQMIIQPFPMLTEEEKMSFWMTLNHDIEAIKRIKHCPILEQYLLDLRQVLDSLPKAYWPQIYTQEKNPNLPSLIERLKIEIARIESSQNNLILSKTNIDSEALVSGLGFKSANHLLEYWEIIYEKISELS